MKLANVICIMASFALVAACSKDKPSKDNPRSSASGMAPNQAPASPTTAPPSRGAPSMAAPAPTVPVANPAPAPMVLKKDPKGPTLTLVERACTDMGSYTNRNSTGNRTFEIVCRNNENGSWHRMCFAGFPTTSPVTDDISARSQVSSHSVNGYFHTHMIVGGTRVNVEQLDCYKVPSELVGKAPRIKRFKRYRRYRGMSSGSSGGSRAYRNPDSGSGSSGSGGSGSPSAYDREQDRKIAALKQTQDSHGRRITKAEQRLDENDERWKRRDKWAASAQTLLNSLKRK